MTYGYHQVYPSVSLENWQKIKKSQRVPFSVALNESVKEFGLTGGWQTLMKHAKWMVAGRENTPPILPEAKNTLLLGTNSVNSRLAYMLWEDGLSRAPETCDVVIDCTGNPLTYAYMYAHLNQLDEHRPFYFVGSLSLLAFTLKAATFHPPPHLKMKLWFSIMQSNFPQTDRYQRYLPSVLQILPMHSLKQAMYPMRKHTKSHQE